MRGNFRLKLQNSPKLPRMQDFIVMQMRGVKSEKGYFVTFHLTEHLARLASSRPHEFQARIAKRAKQAARF